MAIYQIERLNFSNPVDMQKLVDLQNVVYKGKYVFNNQSFTSWYLYNPNGLVISFNALCCDILVAHYALVPIKMEIDSRVVLGALSMATVTHPEHRRKGLFKQLAQLSYDYAAQKGYEFVIGVANANSYPLFIKYLNHQDVGKLDVLIGRNNGIEESSHKTFRMHWDQNTIRWRLGMSSYYKDDSNVYGTQPLWLFRQVPFFHTFMGRVSNELIQDVDIPKASYLRPFNLYIGMGSNARKLGYCEVPEFIKRPPFHLHFLDLTNGNLPKITKDNVFFQLLDFDVA